MPAVVWSAGLCTRSRSPELWTSSLPSDRERAVAVCLWCPVLAGCREWSASLPAIDNSIVAGLDAKGRKQLRKEAQEPALAPAGAGQITPAA